MAPRKFTSEERRRAQRRKAAAKQKRLFRATHAESIAKQRLIEMAACCDLELLTKHTNQDDVARPGCWVWQGAFSTRWTSVKPVVRVGEYGLMAADRAMWIALGRAGLVGRNFLRTTCGHDDCIAPEHLFVTNLLQHRARKAAKKAKKRG